MTRRLRLGQVGGGEGAFIGEVHRIASRIDNRFELVAGAFSATPRKARASAEALGVSADRAYDDFRMMAEREAARPEGIDAVSIVTPNHMHYPVAREFLRHGIHVICDKPLTSDLEDARRLAAIAGTAEGEAGTRFFVTYNYSAYPLIRQAREMVAKGDLGEIRVIQVEYAQGWLASPVEREGLKQAEWRTDPKRSGDGGAIGDIGTHAFHLAGFVTGLKAEALAADLHRFGPGRALDDNAHVLLRYSGGARGVLWCSQVAVGAENGLRLRVFGDRGGLSGRRRVRTRCSSLRLAALNNALPGTAPDLPRAQSCPRVCRQDIPKATWRASERSMPESRMSFRVRMPGRRITFPA